MALREFEDSAGRQWRVWSTHPAVSGDHTALGKFMESLPKTDGQQPLSVRQRYVHGWLAFKWDNDRRRLAPIPAGWEESDVETLRRYLASAEIVADTPQQNRGS